MKKYEVISLSVGGLNNKIFRSGDKVTAANFPQGNAEKLVEQGFIKEISEENLTKSVSKEPNEPVVADTAESGTKEGKTKKK